MDFVLYFLCTVQRSRSVISAEVSCFNYLCLLSNSVCWLIASIFQMTCLKFCVPVLYWLWGCRCSLLFGGLLLPIMNCGTTWMGTWLRLNKTFYNSIHFTY